jgi:TolA-binding protein
LANPYGSAIAAFQDFLREYPNTVKKADANKYLANLYLTTKDYENALIALSNTGLDSKEMKEAYQKVSYYRGVQLFNAIEMDKARSFFNQSLNYPANPTYVALAHFWKAESFYKQEDYKSALKEIGAFEATSGSYSLTEFANARYNKAYCYFMLEDYPSATTSFRLYLDNKKAEARKKQDAELRLGDAYFMQSKYATAVTFYTKYLSYQPSDADYALFQKALCQGLNGDRNDKISTLIKLVRDYPQSKFAVDGLYEQGATLLAMDRNNDALAVFQDFIKKYPQSKHARRALLNVGVIYRNTDQDQKSIETFKKVVADYPATPEANEAIAFNRLVYAKLNRLDEYVEWVETISFADIKRASLDSTLYNTGFDFYSIGNCTEAMSAFNSYLRKFPDGIFMIQANYFLGECAYKAKNDDVAGPALERVVNEPRSEYTERSISMLASIKYAAQNYEKALFYYEQLIGFSEEMTELRKARVGAMRCAVKLDIPNKALQFADVILSDERAEPEVKSEALLVRARSYWKLQDVNRAHQAYDEVKSQTKGEAQAEASYYIAKIQNMNSEYDQSNTTIFWMIDNLPSYQKWRFLSLLVLADNYYKTGDNFQANYTLDFIIAENYNADVVAQAKALKEEIRRAGDAKEQEQKKREEQLNEQIIEIDENAPEEIEEGNDGGNQN